MLLTMHPCAGLCINELCHLGQSGQHLLLEESVLLLLRLVQKLSTATAASVDLLHQMPLLAVSCCFDLAKSVPGMLSLSTTTAA